MCPSTAYQIAVYSRVMQTLVLDGKCIETGYTKVMLQNLRTPMIYTVNGVPLQFGASGGATDADIRFCLDRMACIVRNSLAIPSSP